MAVPSSATRQQNAPGAHCRRRFWRQAETPSEAQSPLAARTQVCKFVLQLMFSTHTWVSRIHIYCSCLICNQPVHCACSDTEPEQASCMHRACCKKLPKLQPASRFLKVVSPARQPYLKWQAAEVARCECHHGSLLWPRKHLSCLQRVFPCALRHLHAHRMHAVGCARYWPATVLIAESA